MRKTACLCILALACCFSAAAQGWGLRSGVDLKYGFQQLKSRDNDKTENSEVAFAMAFTFKQIQFHKEPVGGVAYFGLDTGLSLDFAKYRVDVGGGDYQRGRSLMEGLGSQKILGDWGLMEAEVGIPVGPYVKIAPCANKGNDGFRISAYYHFVPSASGLVLDSKYGIQFNPFNTAGFVIGYKVINVGYEYRYGFAGYNMKSPSDDSVVKEKYTTSAHNVFLRFSFGK